jgi:hypothetical protein
MTGYTRIGALLLVATTLTFAAPSSAQQAGNCSEPSAKAVPLAAKTVVYHNTEYGFCVRLPVSWRGYSIVPGDWEGYVNGEHGDQTVAKGPFISIRNPDWRSDDPRQDIPIMVFTQSQWLSVQAGEFYVSAAPFPPSELGRNSKYVFALPARYNYAFPKGFEEVDHILSGKPLRGCEEQ